MWGACRDHDKTTPHAYVEHSSIRQQLAAAGEWVPSDKAYAGVIESLRRKGYLFTFNGTHHTDCEITCDARRTAHLAPPKHPCNGHLCQCKG